jgi:hypothetical protein
MGTIGIVQAGLVNQQVVEDLPSQDRPGDDPGDVLDGDLPVPDSLGINHDGRPVLALIEAARVVGSGQQAETRLPELDLEGILECLGAVGVAATPLVAGLANIAADENVMSKGRHIASHESWLEIGKPGQAGAILRAGTIADRIAFRQSRRQSISRSGAVRANRGKGLGAGRSGELTARRTGIALRLY